MKKPFVLVLLFVQLLCLAARAQHTVIKRYNSSRRIFCREQWNKKNTTAHFVMYFKNGKVKAEGYQRRNRYKPYLMVPYRSFKAYNAAGKEIERMWMTADSAVAVIYDDRGVLRDQMLVLKRYCCHTGYDTLGRKTVFHECFLPDSLSYFTDYYHPDKWVKKNYAEVAYETPLLPLEFGTSAADGVSAADSYKVYFEADSREPHCVSRGSIISYDTTGRMEAITLIPYQ